MNAEVKKLYEAKGKAHASMVAVGERLKKGEKLTADEETQFNAWDEEYKSADASIKRLELLDEREKAASTAKLQKQEGGDDEGKKEKAKFTWSEGTKAWAKSSSGRKLTEKEKKILDTQIEHDEAFRRFIDLGWDALDESERAAIQDLRNTSFDQDNKRAQTVTTTGGGYTIPQGFWDDIVIAKKLVSPFYEEMKVGPSQISKSIFYFINTATGNDLPMPTVDDTATTGELLAINTDAFANTADLVFGQKIMKAYKINPKPMKVPNELLQDTGVDLSGLIAEFLGTRNGRIINTYFTTGDNTNKPEGIVAGASLGLVSAADNAITFADVLDLEHSVNPAYRKSLSARFMFSDATLKYLKKLSIGSSDARPLWMPSFRDGAPDTIDGYQYLLNEDMATVTDAGKCMLFGDMKQYAIRQAGPPVLKFLGERFSDADQVAWMLLERVDGRYRNNAGIKYLEVS